MSKLLFASMYFTSFIPLWVSVMLMDIWSIMEKQENQGTEYITIICIIIAMVISSGIIYYGLHRCGKEGSSRKIIKTAKEEKSITAEFLLAYILPLFAFDFTVYKQVVLFLIFFITFGYLCIKHNYYCVNILLELAGYRIFRCDVLNKDEMVTEQLIMSKQRLNDLVGMDIYVMPLNNEYQLDVSHK